MPNWFFKIELFICVKMDLALITFNGRWAIKQNQANQLCAKKFARASLKSYLQKNVWRFLVPAMIVHVIDLLLSVRKPGILVVGGGHFITQIYLNIVDTHLSNLPACWHMGFSIKKFLLLCIVLCLTKAFCDAWNIKSFQASIWSFVKLAFFLYLWHLGIIRTSSLYFFCLTI